MIEVVRYIIKSLKADKTNGWEEVNGVGGGRRIASISARGLSQVRQTFEGVCLHSPEVRGFPTELQPAFDRSDAGRLSITSTGAS